ncbi:MAG: type II secretion system F family protein [Cyanobacteria bacterium NC_groundwater_1444_Ag_S-0.65um_54_12]|nr:type II secretion system F family protein [Cyanobacteria bacterium NC_groundwater_1444_Ag_S-0.65um_54_12]
MDKTFAVITIFMIATGATWALGQFLRPVLVASKLRAEQLISTDSFLATENWQSYQRSGSHEAPDPGRTFWRLNWRSINKLIVPLLRNLDPGRNLDRLLWQADWPWHPAEFALACVLLALTTAVAGWYWFGWPAGLAGLSCGLLPLIWARQRSAKRRRSLIEQLPDTLLLIVNALKAGHGLMQAIRIVAAQVSPPSSSELGVLLAEIQLGLSPETAFANLNDRVALVEVELAVGAILVQRETGGNLAEILFNLQETLRERARIAGEVHVLTTQGRLSGWILSALPIGVGIFLTLLSPGYFLPFLADPRGQRLALAALTAQLLGIIAIRRIVNIKY